MKRYAPIFLFAVIFAATGAFAIWPFDDKGEEPQPRISLLMKPVNELIDQAEDRKADGRFSEAVDLYREALNELANVEYQNPDMVDSPAFSTVKNKRAYVNAAIATLQLREAGEEDGLVTLSDTQALESRIEEERKAAEETERKAAAEKAAAARKAAAEKAAAARKAAKEKAAAAKKSAAEKAAAAEKAKKAAAVAKLPANVGGLNRYAAKAQMNGDSETAELALKRAIELFPENHFAYYNLAKLILSKGGDVAEAAGIYQAGRAVGGPVDRELEAVARSAK